MEYRVRIGYNHKGDYVDDEDFLIKSENLGLGENLNGFADFLKKINCSEMTKEEREYNDKEAIWITFSAEQ